MKMRPSKKNLHWPDCRARPEKPGLCRCDLTCCPAPAREGVLTVVHPRTKRSQKTTLPAKQAMRVAADLRRQGYKVTMVLYS